MRASFDLGRGCPFQCSFCTIINVQGRKSRFRTPDDLERIIRENAALGIEKFFITDDNFARNRDWEVLLERLIHLRENEGFKIKLVIQVDTLCHRIPNFVDKCVRAGVHRVFIGLENINPDNLLAAKKRQNKITEYCLMLQAWRAHGVTTYAGYILGFPGNTKESILRDVEIIKRELPIDLLEFFFLTPLPGSEDHKVLLTKGAWMDADLNKYDLNHRVSHHPKMSDGEWEDAYRAAWHAYYTPEHIETVMRRAAAVRHGRPRVKMRLLVWFYLMYRYEGVHPLEGGIIRRKYRRDRRPGLPIENPIAFHAKYIAGTAYKWFHYARWMFDGNRMYKRIRRDPEHKAYSDLAIAPPSADEMASLAMFNETQGGTAAVAKKEGEDASRARVAKSAGRTNVQTEAAE